MLENELQKLDSDTKQTITSIEEILHPLKCEEAIDKKYSNPKARKGSRGRKEQDYRAGLIYYELHEILSKDCIFTNNELHFWNGKFYEKIENSRDKIGRILLERLTVAGAKKNTVVSDDVAMTNKALDYTYTKLRLDGTKYSNNRNEMTLINVANGVMEIKGNNVELKKHDKKYFLKYCLPYEYDEKAHHGKYFSDFLNSSLPDTASQMILQEYIGTVLAGRTIPSAQKCMILLGEGENGKSVFADVIESLLGKQNVSHTSLNKITDRTGYYVEDIVGRLLNYNSELRSVGSEDTFKAIVSREKIIGRNPHEKPFVTDDIPPMIFNCNKLPKVYENSHGIFRRFLIVPFDQIISKENRIADLANKIIRSERPFILKWAIEGLKRYINNNYNFSYCQRSEDAKNEYRTNQCTVLQFIQERSINHASEYKYPAKELYTEYVAFCSENGIMKEKLTKRAMGLQFRAYGYQSAKCSGGIMKYAIHISEQPSEGEMVLSEGIGRTTEKPEGMNDLPF